MKYIVNWHVSSDHYKAAVARFKEAGAPPPEGVTMLGRWHDVTLRHGTALCEADSPAALALWTKQWADLLRFEIRPVLDDEQLQQVLSR